MKNVFTFILIIYIITFINYAEKNDLFLRVPLLFVISQAPVVQ